MGGVSAAKGAGPQQPSQPSVESSSTPGTSPTLTPTCQSESSMALPSAPSASTRPSMQDVALFIQDTDELVTSTPIVTPDAIPKTPSIPESVQNLLAQLPRSYSDTAAQPGDLVLAGQPPEPGALAKAKTYNHAAPPGLLPASHEATPTSTFSNFGAATESATVSTYLTRVLEDISSQPFALSPQATQGTAPGSSNLGLPQLLSLQGLGQPYQQPYQQPPRTLSAITAIPQPQAQAMMAGPPVLPMPFDARQQAAVMQALAGQMAAGHVGSGALLDPSSGGLHMAAGPDSLANALSYLSLGGGLLDDGPGVGGSGSRGGVCKKNKMEPRVENGQIMFTSRQRRTLKRAFRRRLAQRLGTEAARIDNPADDFSNVPATLANAICCDLVDYYLPHAPKLEAFSRAYIAQKVLEEVRKPILASWAPHTEQLAAAMLYSLQAQLSNPKLASPNFVPPSNPLPGSFQVAPGPFPGGVTVAPDTLGAVPPGLHGLGPRGAVPGGVAGHVGVGLGVGSGVGVGLGAVPGAELARPVGPVHHVRHASWPSVDSGFAGLGGVAGLGVGGGAVAGEQGLVGGSAASMAALQEAGVWPQLPQIGGLVGYLGES